MSFMNKLSRSARVGTFVKRIKQPFSMLLDNHQSNSVAKLNAQEDELLTKFKHDQQLYPRPTFAEEVRTMIDQNDGYGVLSTNSIQYPGFPTGSIVGFACDGLGLPIFSFSKLSNHIKDVLADGRVSLTVTAKDFKNAADGRAVLIGTLEQINAPDQVAVLREKYLAKHHDAFYVNFGDFYFFKMKSLQAVRFVGGFGMIGNVNIEDYMKASPDPLSAFATPVMTHMNDDHADAIMAMVQHYSGLTCSSAKIISIDKLGMNVLAALDLMGGDSSKCFKVRLPFPTTVTDRKQVKEVLVEMTHASTKAP